MSLSKVKTKLTSSVTDLKSTQGLKRVALEFGAGAAIGVIVDLLLQFIMYNLVFPSIKWYKCQLWGFNIYPSDAWVTTNPDTGKTEGHVAYDDILLIVVTVMLLATKKLWFVLGFFTGWYSSSYLGLYVTLGLPEPEGIFNP